MKYLIYCKRTNRHLATYTNAKTLETLDTSRCYFEEYDEKKVNDFIRKSKAKNAKTSNSFTKNSSDDYANVINTAGYISTMSSLDSYSSSSNSCDSSSGSSYDSSSSSSCDSSSW